MYVCKSYFLTASNCELDSNLIIGQFRFLNTFLYEEFYMCTKIWTCNFKVQRLDSRI